MSPPSSFSSPSPSSPRLEKGTASIQQHHHHHLLHHHHPCHLKKGTAISIIIVTITILILSSSKEGQGQYTAALLPTESPGGPRTLSMSCGDDMQNCHHHYPHFCHYHPSVIINIVIVIINIIMIVIVTIILILGKLNHQHYQYHHHYHYQYHQCYRIINSVVLNKLTKMLDSSDVLSLISTVTSSSRGSNYKAWAQEESS